MSEFWRRLQYFLNRRRMERELEEEMAAHRAEMHDPTAFGSTLKLREESNDAWGFGWLDRLKQDVVYAARILRRSPSFTCTAVAVLAVGIGLKVTSLRLPQHRHIPSPARHRQCAHYHAPYPPCTRFQFL